MNRPFVPKALSLALAASAIYLPTGALAFTTGDSVPAVVQQIPSGSMGDVNTAATYNSANRAWTVTFRRKLNVGDSAHDIKFETGGTYSFQVATFDNANGATTTNTPAHIGQATKVYSVTLPAAAGDLTFSETPQKLTAISGKLLATNEIEITLSWADTTQDDAGSRYQYTSGTAKTAGTWAEQAGQQDQIAIIWDMQNDGFASSGNCQEMCHTGTFTMSTKAGTKVDSWHWEAAETAPIAHAADEYFDDGSTSAANGRHDDPGRPTYMENDLVNGHPRYLSHIENGESPKHLFMLPPEISEAVKPLPFPADGWKSGDVLPPNVIRPARGGLADTVMSSKHDGSQWTVTFRRKLNTGGDSGHDIVFEKGKSYSFLYAYHNNADHADAEGVSHTFIDPETPFTMSIPASPGPLSFPVKPSKLNAISGQLLDSDEIEISVSWADTTRNDNKRQWSYDPANAATPWTRAKSFSPSVTAEERAARTFASDRFTILWDLQNDGFQTTGNCQQMCHADEPAMRTKAGMLDAWTWTGSASATGYATDQYWDDNGGTGVGDNKSDGGSQSATTANTGLKGDGTAVAGADTVAAALTYTAKAGAGKAATYLYLDTPQADGWRTADKALIDSIKSSVLKVKKPGKDSFSVSGTYLVDENDLGLPGAATRIQFGKVMDLNIPANSFKSQKGGKLLSYKSKGGKEIVTFDTVKRIFTVKTTKQTLTGAAKPDDFTLSVGDIRNTVRLQ